MIIDRRQEKVNLIFYEMVANYKVKLVSFLDKNKSITFDDNNIKLTKVSPGINVRRKSREF